MFSSDDEEEKSKNELFFWNNWNPPTKLTNKANHDSDKIIKKYTTMKCWLPPVNFGLIRDRQANKKTTDRDNAFNDSSHLQNQLGFDWGPPIPFIKSVALIEENEVIWKLFHVNIFGVFKLWKNEYGNISAFAEAEFENGVTDEKAILVINKHCLLRKLLSVSMEEWSALLDALTGTKLILTFNAHDVRNCHISAPLDKLWHYLCKRRHYLPCVSIRMKRQGAKKLTQYLKILPKFVAEEVKTYNRGDIP